MERTDPPVFFVSYARADAEYPEYRENLKKFMEDLSAKVAVGMPTALEGVSFMDPNIQVGEVWSESLGDALKRCRVGVALYTANYFTRQWCGKEFQVFLNRSRPSQGGTGIVPVRWDKFPDPPECAARIQHDSDAFPREYAQMGMRQLVRLRSAYLTQYEFALDALRDRIVQEAKAQRLEPLKTLDFDAVESAWKEASAKDPQSHTQGSYSKTCFVFVSREGLQWAPYEGNPIGALALTISGALKLKYEEIKCNDGLLQKLEEANASDVPVVLFGDPETLSDETCSKTYADPMRQYDTQYFLNCATLIAWEPWSKDVIETDKRWIHLKTKVFKQKVETPPLYHELRSIFSQGDLDQKTRTLIEQIRSRLMKQPIAPRKAEDSAISQSAADVGINIESLPHLEGPNQ
jgi:hypothetical protein